MVKHFTLSVVCLIAIGNIFASPQPTTPVITEVEGEIQVFEKACEGYMLNSNSKIVEYNTPKAAAQLVRNGDDLYFLNFLSKVWFGSYVKGSVEGNQVVVELPQTVYYSEDTSKGYNIAVLQVTESENITENDCLIDESIKSVSFNLSSNGEMELVLPESDNGKKYVVGLVNTEDGSWVGYYDTKEHYTPFDEEMVKIPEGIEQNLYSMKCTSEVTRTDELCTVAFDGDYIYIKGLSYYLPEATIRCNYDKEAGRAYMPQGEFVGVWNDCFIFTEVYEYSTKTYRIEPSPDYQDYVFIVDTFNNKIYCPDGKSDFEVWLYLTFYSPYVNPGVSNFVTNALEILQAITLTKDFDRSGVPGNPYDLSYDEAWGDFEFVLNGKTTEGVEMAINKLYYSIYLNGELMAFLQDDDKYYGFNEPTTVIAAKFTNGDDVLSSGLGHVIHFYIDDIRTLGVQSIYEYGRETTYSEILTLDLATGEVSSSGVDSITASADIVSSVYYTLDGRKIENPKGGIFIRRILLSNGETIVKKVVL